MVHLAGENSKCKKYELYHPFCGTHLFTLLHYFKKFHLFVGAVHDHEHFHGPVSRKSYPQVERRILGQFLLQSETLIRGWICKDNHRAIGSTRRVYSSCLFPQKLWLEGPSRFVTLRHTVLLTMVLTSEIQKKNCPASEVAAEVFKAMVQVILPAVVAALRCPKHVLAVIIRPS